MSKKEWALAHCGVLSPRVHSRARFRRPPRPRCAEPRISAQVFPARVRLVCPAFALLMYPRQCCCGVLHVDTTCSFVAVRYRHCSWSVLEKLPNSFTLTKKVTTAIEDSFSYTGNEGRFSTSSCTVVSFREVLVASRTIYGKLWNRVTVVNTLSDFLKGHVDPHPLLQRSESLLFESVRSFPEVQNLEFLSQ